MDDAARALGVTVDAIRKRVQRGTIPHERDAAAGRVWVLLEAASTMQDTSGTVRDIDQDHTGRVGHELLAAKDETIEELRARVRRLEQDLDARSEELRRRDHLLAAALERIPAAIEAPRDEPEGPETPPAPPEGAHHRPGRARQGLRRTHSGPKGRRGGRGGFGG